MKIRLKHRDNTTQTFYSQKGTLDEALEDICRTCIEEDDTGWFFEMENADPEVVNLPGVHVVNMDGVLYGCTLVDE